MDACTPPFHLGLTGGIGSGKSTVASLLAKRGAAVIDADAISRATTAAGGSALPAIAQTFGAQAIGSDGSLDRAAMRHLVYSDASARQRLEAIIHPLVGAETARQMQKAIAEGKQLLVFDIPLLAESGVRWRQRLDRILVVDCPPEVQIERVAARDQLPRAQIDQIIASQASRSERLAIADWVVFNGRNVTINDLANQVDHISRHMPR